MYVCACGCFVETCDEGVELFGEILYSVMKRLHVALDDPDLNLVVRLYVPSDRDMTHAYIHIHTHTLSLSLSIIITE